MQDKSPSRTALSTAFLRAAHIRIDDKPPVLNDPIALSFLPDYQKRYINGLSLFSGPLRNRFRRPSDPFNAMRSHIVVRARYAEDRLERAQQQGIERYVILAAGLDTYAWRQSEAKIEVLEIDHPTTQGWKQDLIASAKLGVPENLSFLPINFESQSLGEIWQSSDAPDFISWLGVTYYLTRDTISATLKTLAQITQPGTQLVFDFWGKARLSANDTPLLLGTRMSVALLREPMHSFFDVEEIYALAKATGWHVREVSSPPDQNEQYLSGRTDRLKVPDFAYLAHLENPGTS